MGKIFKTLDELIEERASYASDETVGFVPTMGFLHEGHLSLVKKAREENDNVIVSIFVNPAQFKPKEDLSTYPRNIAKDLDLLKKLDVDVVFTPDADAMYPEGFQTFVDPTGPLVNECEGKSRPGHFRGVATIVLKLFNLVKPTNVYFGQKDIQQGLIISHLIKDLHLPIKLHILSIIREKDGLAMSSRNVNLKPNERKAATILFQALQKGQQVFDEKPNKDAALAIIAVEEHLKSEPLASMDYVEIRHPESFEKLTKLTAPCIVLVAATIGKTRLIDNFRLNADKTWNIGTVV